MNCAALVVLATLAAAADVRVTITHCGGGDFVLDTGAEVIYVDPLAPNAANWQRHFHAFRTANTPVPSLVLITHGHNDHCNTLALQQLKTLNPKLVVIAPVDARETLEAVFHPEQILTPIPKSGRPAFLTHGGVKIHVYRSLHAWLTDDIVPYSLTFPFHHEYVVETGGKRIFISGDSSDFREVAEDFDRVDAVLWHIYRPSDIFDIQAIQSLLSPSYFIPYHLNIRYGLSQEDMAKLTDRYRMEDANVVYLIERQNSVELEQRRDPPPALSHGEPTAMEFHLEPDRLFRGLHEPHTIQVLAHVHNAGVVAAAGSAGIRAPEGWTVAALDATSFPRLSPGRDFLCRFRLKGPTGIVLDGQREYAVEGYVTLAGEGSGRQLVKELRFGAGNLYCWNILGPLDNSEGQAGARVSPAEETVDLRRTYTGRNGLPLRWMPYLSRDLHIGYVDMAGLFDVRETYAPMAAGTNPKYVRTEERLAGLAAAFIESPSERDVLFHTGAPYGLYLSLNGQRLFEMPGYDFNFRPEQFQIPARLAKGRNTVLVKIVRGKLPELNLSPWMGFCLRVTDRNQRPLLDLRYSLE